MEIQHWSHEEHPLVLREDKILNKLIKCGVCGEYDITAPFYACETCKYYVEKSCVELPPQIDHSFHPRHPLIFTTRSTYYVRCNSCTRGFDNTYGCSECDFKMDVKCALMPNSMPASRLESQQWVQHSSHPHNLQLLAHPTDDFLFKCFACKMKLSTSGVGVYYGCSRCYYFLHKQCLDQFPQKINPPFHSHHGLLYLRANRFRFKCQLCKEEKFGTLAFECCGCDFGFCLKCGIGKQFIKYEDHEHVLYMIDQTGTEPIFHRCDGYDTYCRLPTASSSNEFRNNPSIFRCLDCTFNIHLICGPLPSIIKHECHVHSLVLVDSLIEDGYGEYYCDVCETERDLRFRVYYCEKCKFIAHIHCVISKVLDLLKADHNNDVELKTVGESQWKKMNNQVLLKDSTAALTLKDFVINKMTEEEKDILRRCYKWGDSTSSSKDEGGGNSIGQFELGDEDINRILQLSRFTYHNFQNFFSELKQFCEKNKLDLTSRDLAMKIIEVEGYMIPYTMGPVLRTLLDNYGDISSGCEESQTFKSFGYFILCKVVKSMCNTTVTDITRNLLQEWYFHLQFVKRWKFKINFALAQFERLICAFLGLQVNKLRDEIPSMLNNNIKKLQEKIEEKKAKLEIIQKEYQGPSPKSEFMEKCLIEASKLKWKKAYESLSSYSTGSPISEDCWF